MRFFGGKAPILARALGAGQENFRSLHQISIKLIRIALVCVPQWGYNENKTKEQNRTAERMFRSGKNIGKREVPIMTFSRSQNPDLQRRPG